MGKALRRVPLHIWLFLASAGYYGLLCSKTYTWVYVSSDSGDWLAASNWWMVPQPYGSPLYILLGHFLDAFPGDLVVKMTVVLSVIPSAVTVTLVYLIVRHLTERTSIALVSSLVLLGSAVFLTQSTVLEEYALTTMLLTAGFWSYLKGHRYLTAFLWGLSAAVHVFVLGAVFFWLVIEWRKLLKPLILVTVPIVGAMYGTILLLMYLDTPRVLAGGLNAYAVEQYLTVTAGAILGQLSVFEAPKRVLLTGRLLLMSFGLALVPLAHSVRRPIPKHIAVMLGIIIWTLWYQMTNIDPASWTFITYASPFLAILVGVGLTKLSMTHLRLVTASAVLLIAANGVFLNANELTRAKPLATDLYDALWELPDDSIVLANTGAYSLGVLYVMSEGKNLVPLFYPYLDDWEFRDYAKWLEDAHNVRTRGSELLGTLEVIGDNLDRGVYYADSPWQQSDIRRCLVLEDTEWTQIKRVVGLTGLEPEPFIK